MIGLTLSRVLTGLASGGVLIGALVLCARWFAPRHFSAPADLMVVMGNLGNLLATTPLAATTEAAGPRPPRAQRRKSQHGSARCRRSSSEPALWRVTVERALPAGFNGWSLVVLGHGRSIFPDRLVGRGMAMLALSVTGGVAAIQMLSGLIVGAFAGPDGLVPGGRLRLDVRDSRRDSGGRAAGRQPHRGQQAKPRRRRPAARPIRPPSRAP